MDAAAVVKTSGYVMFSIMIVKINYILLSCWLLWKSSAVAINQSILYIHISHIQQSFPERHNLQWKLSALLTISLPESHYRHM